MASGGAGQRTSSSVVPVPARTGGEECEQQQQQHNNNGLHRMFSVRVLYRWVAIEGKILGVVVFSVLQTFSPPQSSKTKVVRNPHATGPRGTLLRLAGSGVISQ